MSRDRFVPPGHFRDLDSFREALRGVDPGFGADPSPFGADSALARPLEVAGKHLSNRFTAHPMEGWDGTAEGRPTELTLRRWRRFGRSGAALIWGGEAFAVREDGRANPNQLHLHADHGAVVADLRALLAEIELGRSEVGADGDVLVGLQLTHSGRWSRPVGPPAPRIAAHHPVLDARLGIDDDATLLTDDDLRAIGACYVDAARLAQEAGFDFVDVKACHGYLLHELLGAKGREGAYGGSFANRTRLFVEIVAGIRAACPGLAIGVRVSLADVGPFRPAPGSRIGEPDGFTADVVEAAGFGRGRADVYAFDLDEPFAFLQLCEQLDVRLVNVTLGSPYYCPHLQRPAAYPPSDGYLPPEDPLASVFRHLQVVRAAKAHCPDLVLVGTGYTYLQEWLPHVAHHEVAQGHVDFVGLGRMLLSYPELPLDVLRGDALRKKLICRTFSDCTTAPRNGMVSGCYPLDDLYRARPEAARVRAIKQARTAR